MIIQLCSLFVLCWHLLNPNSSFHIYRHKISCHVVYDDPELGLCAISKPRGRPQISELLKSDEVVQSEINTLRSELTFDSNKKLVLMISFASDEMIRETMKYPEVFFMDCTARVNKQKREFFFSVIRTPSGKCHLSNMTIIPSGLSD